MTLQPAVRKETGRIFVGTAVLTILMVLAFWLLHRLTPESVPFNYKVVISGVCGCIVATLNFLLMAIAVQKVVGTDSEDRARQMFTMSFRYRMLIQLVWAILALAVPCFQGAAGIIPLFFPSLVIKAMGILPGLHQGIHDGQ